MPMYKDEDEKLCLVYLTAVIKQKVVWKQSICQEHGDISCKDCLCVKHKMPREKNEKVKWQQVFHQIDLPKEVYTYFIDGRPTAQNPTPSLELICLQVDCIASEL